MARINWLFQNTKPAYSKICSSFWPALFLQSPPTRLKGKRPLDTSVGSRGAVLRSAPWAVFDDLWWHESQRCRGCCSDAGCWRCCCSTLVAASLSGTVANCCEGVHGAGCGGRGAPSDQLSLLLVLLWLMGMGVLVALKRHGSMWLSSMKKSWCLPLLLAGSHDSTFPFRVLLLRLLSSSLLCVHQGLSTNAARLTSQVRCRALAGAVGPLPPLRQRHRWLDEEYGLPWLMLTRQAGGVVVAAAAAVFGFVVANALVVSLEIAL